MKSFKKFFRVVKNFFTIRGQKKLFSLLNKKELVLFFLFLFFFFSSFSFLFTSFYIKKTTAQPTKGGKIVLGEVGFPAFLNPIYSVASDVDDDITQLLFAGLMKYQDGKIVPDLVERYEVLEEGRIFEFFLKENLFWSDGEKITADDVVFTVKTIQNPEVKSPLRSLWLGVEIEKTSERSFKFFLLNPSGLFLENCTLKIIPKHVWERIPPENFYLSYLNLEPIVSGPYKIERFFRDKEGKIVALNLVENERYFGKKPFIPQISFSFFENEEKLIEAVKNGLVDGFSLTRPLNFPRFRMINFKMPRYFAVFFNLQHPLFSKKEVREALNYATNKKEILEKVFFNQGSIVHSPLLPNIFGLPSTTTIFFDFEKAIKILEENGFQDRDGDGVREKIEIKEPSFQFKNELKLGSKGKEVEELQKCLAKDKDIYPEGEVSGYFGNKTKEAVIKFQEKYRAEILDPEGLKAGNGMVKERTRQKLNEICFERKEERWDLKFSITTTDQPILVETAEILKEQWERLGLAVEIKKVKIEELKREILPKKNYDALLFGQVLNFFADPFPFWHSSQKGEGGFNLSNYENKKADEVLEEIRKTVDEKKKKEKLEEFQEIIIQDFPAVFLYNPDYLYFHSEKLNTGGGKIIFTPSQKFNNIAEWYLKTKRVIK